MTVSFQLRKTNGVIVKRISVGRFIFAAAFIIGLGCGTSAFAQQTGHSYLIDLNSKTVTDLGNVEAIAIKIREKSAISSF